MEGNRLFSDSFWSLSGNALGKGLGVLAGIIMARLLGADIFGEYGMVKSTLAYAAVFSTFGLGYTATRFIAKFNENGAYCKAIIKKSILITLLASFIMLVAICFASFICSGDEKLVKILRFTAMIVVFNALNTTQVGILAGLKDFKSIALNSVAEGIVSFVFGCILTFFRGLDGAVFALFLSTGTQCILNAISIRRNWKIINSDCSWNGQVSTVELLSFSFPVALQEGVFAITSWLRLFLLLKYSDTLQLGLYSASIQWYNIILFVPAVLRNVVLSYFSSTASLEHCQTFKTLFKVNLLASIIPAIILMMLSYPIECFYGPTFSGLFLVLIVSAIASVFGCIANIYTQELISQGRNWIVLLLYIFRDGGTVLILAIVLSFSQEYCKSAFLVFAVSLVFHLMYCLIIRKYCGNESVDY